MRYLVYFIVGLLLTSCAPNGRHINAATAQGFVGQPEQAVLTAWGTPNAVLAGDVKHVDIYKRQVYRTATPTTPAVGINYARGGVPVMTAQNTPGMDTQVLSPTCIVSLTVISGKVVAVQSVGAAC